MKHPQRPSRSREPSLTRAIPMVVRIAMAVILCGVTSLLATAANIVMFPTLVTPFPVTACTFLTGPCNYKIPPPNGQFYSEEFRFETQWKFLGDYPYVVQFSYNFAEDDPLILGGLRRSNSPFIMAGGMIDWDGTQWPMIRRIGSYPTLPALALQIESQDPKDANSGELVFQAVTPRVTYKPMPAPLPASLQKIDLTPKIFNLGTDKPEGGATIGAAGSPPNPNDSIIGAQTIVPGFRLFGEIAEGEFLFYNVDGTQLQISGSSGNFLLGDVDAMIYSLAANAMYGVIGNLVLSGADPFSPFYLETFPDLGSEVLRHMDATLNPDSASFVSDALPYLVLQPRGNLFSLTAGFTLPVDVTVDPKIITAIGTPISEPSALLVMLTAFGLLFIPRRSQRQFPVAARST